MVMVTLILRLLQGYDVSFGRLQVREVALLEA